MLMLALLVATSFALAACGDDDDDGDAPPATATDAAGPGVAIAYAETQCLTNPWQQDWLAAHPGEQFPEDDAAHAAIFEAYWRDQGIALTDARRERSLAGDAIVCQACNCPNGFGWTATAPSGDIADAEAAGFTRAP